MKTFKADILMGIITCFLRAITASNLVRQLINQNMANPDIDCQCVNSGGLPNVHCLRKCFKPYIEQHVATTVPLCDVERCKSNLTDHLFRLQFLKEWLDFGISFPDDALITISLSFQAVEQLSLYVGMDFNLSVTLVKSTNSSIVKSNCRNPWYQPGLFPKFVKPSSIYELTNREVLTKKKNQTRFKYQPDGKIGLLVQINLAGNITGQTLYWPMVLKTVYPPLKPSRPKNVDVKVRRYSDYLVEAVVKWECPEHWNAMPVSYKVKCLLANESNTTVQQCEPSASSCNEQCEFECWQKLRSTGKAVYQKILSWRKQETLVKMKLHRSDEINSFLSCRVQASNSNGNSDWSKLRKRTTLNSPRSTWSNMTFEVQTNHTSWSYVSYNPLKKAVIKVLLTSSVRQLFAQQYKQTRFLPTESNSGKQTILPIGCYDWLANQWYVFVKKLTDGTTWLSIVEQASQFTIVYLNKTTGSPKSIVCDPTSSTLIWSETIKGQYIIKIAHLNSTKQQIKTIDEMNKPCGQFVNEGELAIDVHNSVLFFTSSNPSSHVFWKMNYANPDKKCRKMFNLNFGAKSFVVSLAIFSSPYYPINGKQLLVVLKDKLMKKCSDMPTNGSLTCQENFHNYARDLEFYDFIDGEEGKKILTEQEGEALERLLPTSPDQLEYWPQFVSHIKGKFDGKVHKISSFVMVQSPIALRCMYPNVSDVSSTMTSESTAELLIHITWDDSEICQKISKPKLSYTVMYRLAKDSDQSQTCLGLQCSCFANVSCVKRQKGPTTERMVASIFLPNVKPSLLYYFEMTVSPDLGPFKELWYTDDSMPTTYRRIISSNYVQPSTSYTVALLSTLSPITLILIAIAVLFYWKVLKLYIALHLSQLRQIPVCEIEKTELLGTGNFCHVWKANLDEHKKTSHVFRRSSHTIVAVKELKKNGQGFVASFTKFKQEHEKRLFLEEALLLNHLKHPNIVMALGISMDANPKMLVMEFMDYGSLDLYLMKNRDKLTVSRLLRISLDCCSGCRHLETNDIIHRDIKTKNCLVSVSSHGSITVKLADFGLARIARAGRYEVSVLLIFPVQYTAPEGFYGSFTSKSDVWSFGVLLWEVFSWGADPFGSCSLETNHHCPTKPFKQDQIRKFVVEDQQSLIDLPIPCGSLISRKPCIRCIQAVCWKYDPEDRPTFEIILNELTDKSKQLCHKHKISDIHVRMTETSGSRNSNNLDMINYLKKPDWYHDEKNNVTMEMTAKAEQPSLDSLNKIDTTVL